MDGEEGSGPKAGPNRASHGLLERYRDLFDRAPVGYVVTSRDGRLLRVNFAAGHLLHTPMQFMEGKLLAVYVGDGARERFADCLYHLTAGRHRRLDRVDVDVEPAGDSPHSIPVALIGLAMNDEVRWAVVDRRRDEQELGELEHERDQLARRVAHFESQVESLRARLADEVRTRVSCEASLNEADALIEATATAGGEGALIVDGKGRIRTCSSGVARLLGRPSADVVGRDLDHLVARCRRLHVVGRRVAPEGHRGDVVVVAADGQGTAACTVDAENGTAES